jgi:hypothetical protein
MSKAHLSPVRAIVQRFGGTRPLARSLGLPPTTVQYWVTTGTIPSRHIVPLMALARTSGVRLKADDFLVAPKKR